MVVGLWIGEPKLIGIIDAPKTIFRNALDDMTMSHMEAASLSGDSTGFFAGFDAGELVAIGPVDGWDTLRLFLRTLERNLGHDAPYIPVLHFAAQRVHEF
jgi:hypothetical protein